MKRITGHWSASTYEVTPYVLSHYHEVVDHLGNRHEGLRPPEANRGPLGPDYVRHCGGFNTDNIGLAMIGMHGAVERPFDAGDYPLTPAQFREFCNMTAEYAINYQIPITRRTVFWHAEVLPRFGRGVPKWDCMWLPGLSKPLTAFEAGDYFRDLVKIARLQILDGKLPMRTRLRERIAA